MCKSQAEINAWIRSQQMRLGIEPSETSPNGGSVSTVTVMLPSMAAVTRVAHAAADERIAADPRYASMCARLDAELAEIVASGPNLAHAKDSSKSRSGLCIMRND